MGYGSATCQVLRQHTQRFTVLTRTPEYHYERGTVAKFTFFSKYITEVCIGISMFIVSVCVMYVCVCVFVNTHTHVGVCLCAVDSLKLVLHLKHYDRLQHRRQEMMPSGATPPSLTPYCHCHIQCMRYLLPLSDLTDTSSPPLFCSLKGKMPKSEPSTHHSITDNLF